MSTGPKDAKSQSDYQVVRALALAEKLMSRPAGAENSPPPASPPSPTEQPGDGLSKTLGYWLWRAGGRALTPDAERLAEHYERDMDRLAKRLEAEHAKAMARQAKRVAELERLTGQLQQAHAADIQRLRKELTAELIAARATGDSESRRVEREADQRVEHLVRAHEAELIHLHDSHTAELHKTRRAAMGEMEATVAELRIQIDNAALTRRRELDEAEAVHRRELEGARRRIAELEEETKAAANDREAMSALQRDLQKARLRIAELERQETAQPSVASAQARIAELEERARLAENKVEVLKEALDIARIRSGSNNAATAADPRFRDAKRAFARTFHPDQGGRDSAERQRAFLAFWPELERIEREG